MDELLNMLDGLEELKTYQKMESVINQDKALRKKLAEMKAIQKQLVNAEKINKQKAAKQFETDYLQIRNQIESDPIVDTYLELQKEINDLLVEIKEIIETEINKSLNYKI